MLILNKCIGDGSFSKVYEYEWGGRLCAVKREVGGIGYLEREYGIYKYLYERDVEKMFMVPLYDFLDEGGNKYMFMKKLHMSMGDIMKKLNESFDNYSVRNIGIRLLEILEFMHDNGVCHCDIKPENIMINSKFNRIYLIDFGLSRYYMKNGKHIPIRDDVNVGGTLRYMSVHTNNKIEISRRDDLISLGYVLVYLQKRFLPWQSVGNRERFYRVAKMKLEIDFGELCRDCVPELEKYFEYCYELGFEERPDYDFLKKLFKDN